MQPASKAESLAITEKYIQTLVQILADARSVSNPKLKQLRKRANNALKRCKKMRAIYEHTEV